MKAWWARGRLLYRFVAKQRQINLHHSKTASAALLLRLTEGGSYLVLVQEPWVVGGKVAGLGTKEYTLMLDPKDPKEGKIRTCILANRHLSIFLLRNYSNQQTILNLTLVSDSLVGAVEYWTVSDEHSFTENRFI